MARPKFKFNLGDIVVLDPTGTQNGPRGKITGRAEYIDGAVGYQVSSIAASRDSILRNLVSEHEIRLDVKPVTPAA